MLRITDRDKQIFNILFRLRYMTIKQLSLYLGCTMRVAYVRISTLVKNEYLESIHIENIDEKIYANGSMIRKEQDRSSYKKKIHIWKYILAHHLVVNDIYIHLVNRLSIDEDDITTEREMFWKRTGLLEKRKKIKIPDLIIKKDKKLVAIEYEKSMKDEEAIRDIFRNYSLNTSFYCVRYLCSRNAIKEKINKVAKEQNKTFIKAYTIDDFFNEIDIFEF